MRREQHELPVGKTLVCPDCAGTSFRYNYRSVVCTNCGWTFNKPGNKYGAQRTEYNGRKYDSKYEAGVAGELDLRLRAGDILEVIPQFKIEATAYRSDGTAAFTVRHKVDFRIQLKDGSYELVEAKGQETDDYKWRRKFLEEIFLPEHPDYVYTVVKQAQGRH